MDNGTGSIFQRCVALDLRTARLGVRRKARAVQATGETLAAQFAAGVVLTDADPDMVGASKRILVSPTLDAIAALDGEARRFVRARCLPSPLRAGVHLLPTALVQEVDARLVACRAQRRALVEQFVGEYDAAVAEARTKLAHLFDEDDYYERDDLGRTFAFRWSYLSFEPPERLSRVSRDVWERARDEATAQWAEASAEIQRGLRESFKALVDHMVARLTDGADGPRRIHGKSVDKFVSFLELFQARNIADDAELATLVGQARALMDGTAPEDLRDSAELRAAMQEAFAQVQVHVDALVVDAPRRHVVFGESRIGNGGNGDATTAAKCPAHAALSAVQRHRARGTVA